MLSSGLRGATAEFARNTLFNRYATCKVESSWGYCEAPIGGGGLADLKEVSRTFCQGLAAHAE